MLYCRVYGEDLDYGPCSLVDGKDRTRPYIPVALREPVEIHHQGDLEVKAGICELYPEACVSFIEMEQHDGEFTVT